MGLKDHACSPEGILMRSNSKSGRYVEFSARLNIIYAAIVVTAAKRNFEGFNSEQEVRHEIVSVEKILNIEERVTEQFEDLATELIELHQQHTEALKMNSITAEVGNIMPSNNERILSQRMLVIKRKLEM
ncbi:hypothetical protein CDAR_503671 [Caerostris darwini]|uniref:Uncharacterized protein n=1 Tax=Caerostris darwini TaxID=1538125 RepID=A0AAV4NUF9_9ARAC|nr:hypothetical protein CDAR_503671 [Caerostris darwini]